MQKKKWACFFTRGAIQTFMIMSMHLRYIVKRKIPPIDVGQNAFSSMNCSFVWKYSIIASPSSAFDKLKCVFIKPHSLLGFVRRKQGQ